MARPVDQLSQEGGKREGDRFSPQKCGSTTDSAERNVWSDLRPITIRPTHTTWGAPRMRCNAVQCNFQSPFDWPCCRFMRPSTARRTHTSLVDQQAGTSRPTPLGGVGRTGAARWEIAAPTAREGSQGSSRGRDFGGPRRWRRGMEGRAGQTECIFHLSFFIFFCLADVGRRRSGSPGITLMSLGTGFGLCV